MSIASRIRAAAETYPDDTPYDVAIRLMGEGVSDDELHWLLVALLKTEQGRHRGKVTTRFRNIPVGAADDVHKKKSTLRDPRAQRVVNDFLESRITVFGQSKAMRDLTIEDCTEAARVRKDMAKTIKRSATDFELAAYIMRERKVERLGDLTPGQLKEAFKVRH